MGFVGACVILSIHEFVRRNDAMLCVWYSSEGSVAAVARLPMSGALELHADLGRCLPGSHVHYTPSALVFSLHAVGSDGLPARVVSSGGH